MAPFSELATKTRDTAFLHNRMGNVGFHKHVKQSAIRLLLVLFFNTMFAHRFADN